MSEPDDSSLIAVERLALQLRPDQQLVLMEHLARRLRTTAHSRQPQDLYGILRWRIPEDFDVDGALKDIRSAWQRDFE
jgi:hypothetical protein